MGEEILEKILTSILDYYMNVNFVVIENSLRIPGYVIKERIETVRHMQIIIYSNDHNPPHFHVISSDNSVNAKFTIETCELISGEIGTKDIKRIKAFYQSPKTEILMKKAWNKKSNNQ